MKFLVKVTDEKNHSVFIDNLVLEGIKEELIKKLWGLASTEKLDIHESFLFDRFILVSKKLVNFPDHRS